MGFVWCAVSYSQDILMLILWFSLSLCSHSHNQRNSKQRFLILILWFTLTHTITHSHTLLITCTCCYDEIKGTQDKDFSYSFSDSLSLYSLCLWHLNCALALNTDIYSTYWVSKKHPHLAASYSHCAVSLTLTVLCLSLCSLAVIVAGEAWQ